MTDISPSVHAVVVDAPQGDWSGLFLNGKLAFEGHSLHVIDIFDALKGKTLKSFEQRACDEEWIADNGNFPGDLTRVRWPKGVRYDD